LFVSSFRPIHQNRCDPKYFITMIWFIITNFRWAVCCLIFFIPIIRPYLAHRLWQKTPHSLSWNWAHGGCDRSTRGVYSPRHLIPPLVFLGIRVGLIFTVLWIVPFAWSGRWFWLRISSVCLIWRIDFGCGFFCLSNLDTLMLTDGFCVWNRTHGGCDRSTEDAYSSYTPDPTSSMSGCPC
jgi:hypothetical protein